MFEAIVAKISRFIHTSVRLVGDLINRHPVAASAALLALMLVW